MKKKGVFLAALVGLVSAVVFAAYMYGSEKAFLLREVEGRLVSSANAVRYILPEGYHDRIGSASSVSPREHVGNVRKLSAYARHARADYLYTMMESGSRVVFTSTSAKADEFRKGAFDPFFAVYENPTPGLRQAFRDHKAVFEESRNKYGVFRSVFIPVITASGKVYIMGADVDTRSVDRILMRCMLKALVFGSIVFLMGMAAVFLVLRWLTVSLSDMQDQVQRITDTRDVSMGVISPGNDELGDIAGAPGESIVIIRDSMAGMKICLDDICRTSSEMVSQGADLASHAQDQYDVMSETSKTLEDLSLIMRKGSQQSALVEAELEAFIQAMHERMALISAMNESMSRIDASSLRTEKIIGVVNEIAFQSNLLALGASVEADRSGGNENGSCVLAQEVRNFSRKTNEISQDIEHIIRENGETTRTGLGLFTEASDLFGEIIEQFTEMRAKISRMFEAIREQGSGIEYIDGVVARAQETLECNTDRAGSLAESSRELQGAIEHFRKMLEPYSPN